MIGEVPNAHEEGGGKGWADSEELAPETEGWLEGPEENPKEVETQMRCGEMRGGGDRCGGDKAGALPSLRRAL